MLIAPPAVQDHLGRGRQTQTNRCSIYVLAELRRSLAAAILPLAAE